MRTEDGRPFPGGNRLAWSVAAAVAAAAAAIRFAPFVLGGTLYRRDAGFFFVPWRLVLSRSLAARELPFWNEWMSAGRPFAADPNAAAFWPLSPLLLLLSPTALALASLALVLAAFFFALRRLGLSPSACASGTLVLLFSGVFQSLPLYFTTCAAVLPLPFALAEAPRLAAPDPTRRGRSRALVALAFGLSALAGEPAVTLMGAAAFAAVVALMAVTASSAGESRARALPGALLAFVLGAGLAAIQICPAVLELSRSARGVEMRPEHGALFRSVRPSRVLTLLEPRLTGDPEGDGGPDWGARTFDGGSPYFGDLALGLLPLVFAGAAFQDRRGRAALLLALAGTLLSFGRFLPGVASLSAAIPVLRYPEKWWLLVTFALAAAAAVGVDLVFSGPDESRARARKSLLLAAVVTALLCGALLALSIGAEDSLRRGLWALGLGAGDTPAGAVSSLLRPLFLLGSLTLVLVVALGWLVSRNRLPVSLFAAILALLFLADAARRVAGTCPAGPPDLYRRVTPEVALVRAEAGAGRFYDDGADDPATVARRTREAGGFDSLHPAAGVAFGLRYAGENDVDRMTAAPSVRFARSLAALPWGDAKAARLRVLGVTVVRTPAPAPDPAGAVEVGRSGGDRILRLLGARRELSLLPAGAGVLDVGERRSSALRLRARVNLPAAVLFVGRTFDPNWHARLDGREIPVRPADAFQMAVDVPRGDHEILFFYRNPAFLAGGALSLASVLAFGFLFRRETRA